MEFSYMRVVQRNIDRAGVIGCNHKQHFSPTTPPTQLFSRALEFLLLDKT